MFGVHVERVHRAARILESVLTRASDRGVQYVALAAVNAGSVEAVCSVALRTIEMRLSAVDTVITRVKADRSSVSGVARTSACEARLLSLAADVSKLLACEARAVSLWSFEMR